MDITFFLFWDMRLGEGGAFVEELTFVKGTGESECCLLLLIRRTALCVRGKGLERKAIK